MYNISLFSSPSFECTIFCTKEREAAQGRQHKDPRKETEVPQAFEDQADISPEFCIAVKDINTGLRMFLRKQYRKIRHQQENINFQT